MISNIPAYPYLPVHSPKAKGAGNTAALKSEVYAPGDCLSEALARAVQNFKERMLSGLNGLTQEDIEEKIEEFKALWKPVNGTEEELAAFEKKLADFKYMLNKIATGKMLISSAGLAENEGNAIAEFKRAQIMAASPMLQKSSHVNSSNTAAVQE